MNPLTEARQALAAALEPLGVVIYATVPEAGVKTPAAVVQAGDPWAVQATYGALRTTWVVTMMATMQGKNVAAMERLEQLVWDADAALTSVGVVVGPTAPRVQKIGAAEVALSDLTVQVLVTTQGES